MIQVSISHRWTTIENIGWASFYLWTNEQWPGGRSSRIIIATLVVTMWVGAGGQSKWNARQSEWVLIVINAWWLFIFLGIHKKYFNVWVWENTSSSWWHCWALETDCKLVCGFANVMEHPDRQNYPADSGRCGTNTEQSPGLWLWSSHAPSWGIKPWEYKSMQGKQKIRGEPV